MKTASQLPVLGQMPIAALRLALSERRVTAAALLEQARANHKTYGEVLNGYKLWHEEGARQLAAAADAALDAGADTGLLQGLPVAVKDVFGLRGTPTYAGAGRPLGEDWSREGPIVSSWRQQLAVVTGKAHTVEFALGVIGTNPNWGAPRNPWDAEHYRVSGGSTSGAGPILHGGSAVLVLGSDAGGSIRIPASLTGCVGIRTSVGRLPVGGSPPLAPSLDTPGLVARTAADLAYGFAAMDGTTPIGLDAGAAAAAGLSSLRIGIADRRYWQDCGPGVVETVEQAMRELEARGAQLIDVPLPETDTAIEFSQHGGLTVPEVYFAVRHWFTEHVDGIDRNVWNRLSSLGDISASEYLRRKVVVRAMVDSINARFDEVDVLAMPTNAITAPTLDEVSTEKDYRTRNVLMGRNAYLANLADTPAVSLVAGLDSLGLPVGLQLSARRMNEDGLLRTALKVEAILGTPAERVGPPPLGSQHKVLGS